MEEAQYPKTREEWFALVKEQEDSKQSQADFCKERQIKPHQLSYYRQQYQIKFGNQKQELSFAPVIVNESKTKVPEIKIQLPNGFSCCVPSTISPEHLKKLLGAILSC